MTKSRISVSTDNLTQFSRDFWDSGQVLSYIGDGSVGGKASGLAFIKDVVEANAGKGQFEGFTVSIPKLAVIATGFFDKFMKRNDLYDVAFSDLPDSRIAHAFQKADLPAELVGDLRSLIIGVHSPLAIRSSSLLEDAMYEPFAGVYATKMIPNNQFDVDLRFRKLVEAVKFVYASTFFKAAKNYIQATGRSASDEKMAVIVQEVVGCKFEERYYPHFAGVARSHNFYPVGRAKPSDGVVDLAVGLGKTIVDGGLAWTYSPAYPRVMPPVGSPSELLKQSQTRFWAVNMGKAPEYDPIRETEYMSECDLQEAEADGTLSIAASTYRPADDRLVPGIGSDGPRVVTFAPILSERLLNLNNLIVELLSLCEEAVGSEVEIEFAVTMKGNDTSTAHFGFLQVRPMVVSNEKVEVAESDLLDPKAFLSSDKVLGNGTSTDISDIVYVRPEIFEAKNTRVIANQLETINRQLKSENTPYVLIGFGRWGSSDPWLGIPAEWGQVSGARAIVEATLPDMNVDLSQGSHFFHNISSFGVFYFMVRHDSEFRIDWDWLNRARAVRDDTFVRHVRLDNPLTIRVDGRHSRGVILK